MEVAGGTAPQASLGVVRPSLPGTSAAQSRNNRNALVAPGHSLSRPSGRKFTCIARVTLDRLPLSSYEFPPIPSGAVEPTPLELAVKDAVKNLEQAPFLQVQQGRNISRHAVENSVIQAPQLWDSIAEHLTQRQAGMVLLVHRLEDPAPDRIVRTVPCCSNVMTGITSASQATCLESFEELLRTETAHAEYSGRVGDCCDDEVVSQVVPFTRHTRRRSSHGHQHQHSVSFQLPRGGGKEKTSYWGVVLQSKVDSNQDSGCYILKTLHSGIGDCTCVHWTLTRVCRGASLFDQINSAWLV